MEPAVANPPCRVAPRAEAGYKTTFCNLPPGQALAQRKRAKAAAQHPSPLFYARVSSGRKGTTLLQDLPSYTMRALSFAPVIHSCKSAMMASVKLLQLIVHLQKLAVCPIIQRWSVKRPLPKPLHLLQRKPKRSTERQAVTVCIAAACDRGARVVVGADTALSFQDVTADTWAHKFVNANKWTVMFAGDLGTTDLLVDEITGAIVTAPDDSHQCVAQLVRQTYRRKFADWSADRWLSPLGLDMPAFLSSREQLGDRVFADIIKQIHNDANNFTGELLVCGWGVSEPTSSIFSINRDGLLSHRTAGCGAIGSGGSVALTTMFAHGHNIQRSIVETIYCVCAAKFMAEHCTGVGPNTLVWVSEKYGDGFFVQPFEVEQIKAEWWKLGRPQIIPSIERNIAHTLRDRLKIGP